MRRRLPKTKEECFQQLDKLTDDEYKQQLITEGSVLAHFDLGLWIRNNWIYNQPQEKLDAFLALFEDLEDAQLPCHPDIYSGMIIDQYIEYLKKKA